MTTANEDVAEPTEPQIDPDHPWVEASKYMQPRPADVLVKIEAVDLTIGDHEVPAALMNIVLPTGVHSVFLTPQMLAAVLNEGAAVLESFRPPSSGLVVADAQDMKRAGQLHDAANRFKEK